MKSKGFISKCGVNSDSENGLNVQPSGQGRKLPSKNRTTPLEEIVLKRYFYPFYWFTMFRHKY